MEHREIPFIIRKKRSAGFNGKLKLLQITEPHIPSFKSCQNINSASSQSFRQSYLDIFIKIKRKPGHLVFACRILPRNGFLSILSDLTINQSFMIKIER